MSVQARFFIQSITRNAASNHVQVVMAASGRGPENKTWAQYTPMGKLEMSVNNPEAAKWFEEHLGQDVALVFQERPVVCPQCKTETGVTLTSEHQVYIDILCKSCGHTFNPASAGYPPKER
jgi:hypothetical protein